MRRSYGKEMKEQSIFYFSPYLLRKYEITDVGNEEYSKLKVSYGTLREKFKVGVLISWKNQ